MRPEQGELVITSTAQHTATDSDRGQPRDTAADRSGERPRLASGPGGPARSADRHGPPPDNGSPPETNADRSATVSGRGHEHPEFRRRGSCERWGGLDSADERGAEPRFFAARTLFVWNLVTPSMIL